jgi:hypothetical protein
MNTILKRGLPIVGLGLAIVAVRRWLDFMDMQRAESVAQACRIDRTPYPSHRVREAGRDAMSLPPRKWDIVDEQADASFPASDPPGSY